MASPTVEAFGDVLGRPAIGRRVVAVELQGHGCTRDADRPLTRDALADDHGWSDEVCAIGVPVLPGHADCDGVPPAHAAEFSALLGGGPRDPGRTDPGVRHPGRRSCPGAGHYDVLAAPEFVAVVDGFLSGPVG